MRSRWICVAMATANGRAEWEYGTRHYIADLDELIDNWGLGAPVLVGHSMGGHNVMVYASRHSEKLRAIVAIDSPADYPEQRGRFAARLFRAARQALQIARRGDGEFPDAAARDARDVRKSCASRARHTFRQTPEGEWIHKLDRRTTIREPINIGSDLGKITARRFT